MIQTDWEPEAESGIWYHLVGPGYTVDISHKRVSGPLVIDGLDTGVQVEIRAGGAAIGFTAPPAQMYLDKSITLAAVRTDQAISTTANQPVIAVFAPMTKSPEILLWDPARHPDWKGIQDIGRSQAKVLVTKDTNTAELLVAQGRISSNQVDTGYTGTPARFVADPTVAQQGYATSDPYIYQHELPAWNKPVRYDLLAPYGYSIYPGALSVRAADLQPLSACLQKLVPILQQAQRDYITDPAATNQLIVELVDAYNDGWTNSLGVTNYAVDTMKKLGIVANDTSGPLGGMDPIRLQNTINTFAPILTATGAHVRPNLTAADIATNRFLDPTITATW